MIASQSEKYASRNSPEPKAGTQYGFKFSESLGRYVKQVSPRILRTSGTHYIIYEWPLIGYRFFHIFDPHPPNTRSTSDATHPKPNVKRSDGITRNYRPLPRTRCCPESLGCTLCVATVPQKAPDTHIPSAFFIRNVIKKHINIADDLRGDFICMRFDPLFDIRAILRSFSTRAFVSSSMSRRANYDITSG